MFLCGKSARQNFCTRFPNVRETSNLRGNLRKRFIALLALLICLRNTSANVSLGAHLVCAKVPGLSEKQRAMCRASPAAIATVGDGLSMAYAECRSQLAGSRWNCSGVGEDNVFGHIMPLATKEAAFIYAITSAGVTHALSSGCARGDLPGCGCRTNTRRRISHHNPEGQFQWGGCADISYSTRFARRFLDARELEADARSLMNLHNNRVGRKIVKDLVRQECKCHGVSGSCAMKTCWKALPPFPVVASALKEKYLKAKLVTSHPPASTHAPHTHLVIRRSKPHSGLGRQPRKSELVYLEASPSYCEPDPVTGALGTHGRHCNRTSRGEDGCETLCCGRGYNSVRTVKSTQCRCQFHWCCHVTCDTCTQRLEYHICK